MKKVIAAVCLLSATVALAACSTTASNSDVKSANKVFEKKVTK